LAETADGEEWPMWVLLLVPFIGLLWVSSYNMTGPVLFGFPFFYWYQLAWVPVTALLTWLVYRRTPHLEERRGP
jgi:FtsH-binding integral membrane protein